MISLFSGEAGESNSLEKQECLLSQTIENNFIIHDPTKVEQNCHLRSLCTHVFARKFHNRLSDRTLGAKTDGPVITI